MSRATVTTSQKHAATQASATETPRAGAASLRALVVGAGSIGSRHARNLRSAGIRSLEICDPHPETLRAVAGETGARAFASLEEAIADGVPDVALICSPPNDHVAQATRLVANGAHVFVEKPLSDRVEGIQELDEAARGRGRIVQVGYNLRFHPGVRKLKEIVDGGSLGRILWARFEVGQYLPDWRPGRDYRETYTAQAHRGGGILLDASHEIDLACWLLGNPVQIGCMTGLSGSLDMDAEDSATVLLRFASGAHADIHLDCLQRTYTRQCKLAGELGTVMWDYTQNRLHLWCTARPEWQAIDYEFVANDMYVAELNHFLECALAASRPSVGISEGMRAVCLVEAARGAARELRTVNEP